MITMLTEQDLINDLKALLSWAWSIVFDFALWGSLSGGLSFVASVLGVIYLYHRIRKIIIDVSTARIDKLIKEAELEAIRQRTLRKVDNK